MKVDRKFLRTRVDFIEEAEALAERLRVEPFPPGLEDHRAYFLREIGEMIEEVRSGGLPPPPRKRGMGWLVIDSWPLAHPLGSEIVRLELVYEQLT